MPPRSVAGCATPNQENCRSRTLNAGHWNYNPTLHMEPHQSHSQPADLVGAAKIDQQGLKDRFRDLKVDVRRCSEGGS
jgi:hypothetical protein